jgi:hypothetical protein
VHWRSGVSCACESSGVGTDHRDCGGVCAFTKAPHWLCLESMRRCSDVAGELSFSVRFLAMMLMITTCLSCLPSRYQNRRESGSNTRPREGQGAAVTDRVLRIVIGACTCVAFLLLGTGKNNVMAKGVPPLSHNPLSHTIQTGGSSGSRIKPPVGDVCVVLDGQAQALFG